VEGKCGSWYNETYLGKATLLKILMKIIMFSMVNIRRTAFYLISHTADYSFNRTFYHIQIIRSSKFLRLFIFKRFKISIHYLFTFHLWCSCFHVFCSHLYFIFLNAQNVKSQIVLIPSNIASFVFYGRSTISCVVKFSNLCNLYFIINFLLIILFVMCDIIQ